MKLNIKKLQNGQTIELTLPNGVKKKVETNSKEYKSLYPNVTTKINEDTYYKNLPDVNITAKNWLSHSVRKGMNEAGKNMMTGIGTVALVGTGAAGLVSAPLAFIGSTAGGIAGDYLTNKATDIISKGKYKNWGEFAGDKTGIPAETMAFTNPGAIFGGGFGSLLKPKHFIKSGKYLLNKTEPYLMGDKKIPMMSGYKPKIDLLDDSENFISRFSGQNHGKDLRGDALNNMKNNFIDSGDQIKRSQIKDTQFYKKLVENFESSPDIIKNKEIDMPLVHAYQLYLKQQGVPYPGAYPPKYIQALIENSRNSLKEQARGVLKDDVFFHATNKFFDKFDFSKVGNATGNNGVYGPGFYFTPAKQTNNISVPRSNRLNPEFTQMPSNHIVYSYHYGNTTQPYIISNVDEFLKDGSIPIGSKFKWRVDESPFKQEGYHHLNRNRVTGELPKRNYINGYGDEVVVGDNSNIQIKSIFPHPSLVKNLKGTIKRSFKDPRYNYAVIPAVTIGYNLIQNKKE